MAIFTFRCLVESDPALTDSPINNPKLAPLEIYIIKEKGFFAKIRPVSSYVGHHRC
ncbi:hypothetical protein VCRA2119O147_630010 [Vibrio crassostreae]|nr:hypothetical protein VCRA2118O144_100131 [Vibrio crassostreae]CAK2005198.1 hypothetical protein VCRA2114O369_20230 [Vibrio crassostreae]CAK2009530.1 hypothetical protein VCRA2113O354_20230 [Vibrio crassostreae]CAK2012164.1 hypothetical protein VCRA2113O362_20283 [Vibrio crassostreae]CAK2016031.1 hypothetical protein VCRA2113O359_20283 [Vibrio crassostreae]